MQVNRPEPTRSLVLTCSVVVMKLDFLQKFEFSSEGALASKGSLHHCWLCDPQTFSVTVHRSQPEAVWT